MPAGADWSHFEHSADIGVRGEGPDLATAFEQAAIALTAVITDPAEVRDASEIEVQVTAPDPDLLLVMWLNAIVYEMATRAMLFSRFAVTIDGDTLTATLWGEPVEPARHHPAVEIKGATLTELKTGRLENGSYVAQCVVDV